MSPTLSVITICFNNLTELIQTAASVEEQTLPPTEHLVIDGSDNDEIVNWLLQSPQPAYRRWIHERDKGISDAFNKGITHAKGDITHLLNAGDRYYNTKAIEIVLQQFNADPSLMWTQSQYVQHRGDIDVITGLPFEQSKLWKGMRTVAHPSLFIKKEVYDRHGLYNTDYKIAMDYDMLLRMRAEKFHFIPLPLVYFAPGGASGQQFDKGLAEVKRSYRTHIGADIRQTVWQWRQKLLHIFMQTNVGKKWFQQKNKKKNANYSN